MAKYSKAFYIPQSQYVDAKDQKIILRPYKHIFTMTGKGIRPRLSRAFNFWTKLDNKQHFAVDNLVNLIHTTSLLFDDIEDFSDIRRCVPVAHNIYGLRYAIYSSMFALFLALDHSKSLGDSRVVKATNEELLDLHRGQGMEIYYRDMGICPPLEEYRLYSIGKTGGMFMMLIKLLQLFSDNKSNFRPLVDIMGYYIQIRDDFGNLKQKEVFMKSFAEDITEGKFSFLTIHAMNHGGHREEIMNILRQHTRDNGVKRHCINLLDQAGSFKYTLKKLIQLDEEARKEADRLGSNPIFDEIMDDFAFWRIYCKENQ